MSAAPDVARPLGAAPVRFTPRPDGTLLVTPEPALGAYPRSLTECLARHAAEAPERTLIAQRDAALDGDWRRISYLDMWQAVAVPGPGAAGSRAVGGAAVGHPVRQLP
jgi:feruloyl-CoA synthase